MVGLSFRGAWGGGGGETLKAFFALGGSVRDRRLHAAPTNGRLDAFAHVSFVSLCAPIVGNLCIRVEASGAPQPVVPQLLVHAC